MMSKFSAVCLAMQKELHKKIEEQRKIHNRIKHELAMRITSRVYTLSNGQLAGRSFLDFYALLSQKGWYLQVWKSPGNVREYTGEV